ncbi:unnamed protein product [Paramecium primaurelia]|uniref:Uncharacterized protein n=1 Tax=Paramecium primaurelia TaxID=5886 RepID=A0A8S1MD54_PARPR|nr:unnamed protein product [Paramecium primaurelia]
MIPEQQQGITQEEKELILIEELSQKLEGLYKDMEQIRREIIFGPFWATSFRPLQQGHRIRRFCFTPFRNQRKKIILNCLFQGYIISSSNNSYTLFYTFIVIPDEQKFDLTPQTK